MKLILLLIFCVLHETHEWYASSIVFLCDLQVSAACYKVSWRCSVMHILHLFTKLQVEQPVSPDITITRQFQNNYTLNWYKSAMNCTFSRSRPKLFCCWELRQWAFLFLIAIIVRNMNCYASLFLIHILPIWVHF